MNQAYVQPFYSVYGRIMMSDKKPWLAVVVGVGLVLNGCAGMSKKNEAALIGALGCGIPAAVAGGLVSNNNHPDVHMPVGGGVAIGLVTGALLCGGLAYLLTPEPPPPSPTPPPPPPPPPKPKPAPPPPPPPPPPAPQVERTIILDDVLFDFDKSTIKPEAAQILDRLVAFMNDNKNSKVSLSGYTDNVGTEAYNLKLSDRRWTSVKDYVVKKGVDGSRVSGQGFGESKPIADNKTAAGRAKNRRVEIKVN
jgi:outer membrane protein OmpA-like peptidoglycan-associated protein